MSPELEALKLKVDQAKARYEALEARLSTQARKNDTRRKVIAGALLFDAAAKDQKYADLLNDLLTRNSRSNDQKPFHGWEIPSPEIAKHDAV